MRILVVEDEKDLNNVITKKLEAVHYSVDACFDGKQALEYIELAEYDAIILDIMMPLVDGIQVLKKMRLAKNNTPVLLLTAKDSIEDRVVGLDAGADDYLVKPFSFEELLARLRAMLRRASNNTSNCYTLANLTVDCDTRTVFRDDVEISLSSKEFSILEYMIRNSGIVLSRDKIEQHIWNYDYEGGSNVVDVYIRYLRKKIDDNYSPKLIHTLRGTGYVLRVNE
ncbi:response regulator transcription factor [Clostridium sp. Marseille-P299]|uniref:response regulator transcription factor n=1 Tax=Clostridium sp. Marseille-P299 TaxID=1805477 RepID=UPI0008335A7E|nr:response regulator transcription factor [Clostridium sp. Marseille-P299]